MARLLVVIATAAVLVLAGSASAQFLPLAMARVNLRADFKDYADMLDAHTRVDRCHHVRRDVVTCRVRIANRSLLEVYVGRVRRLPNDFGVITARRVAH